MFSFRTTPLSEQPDKGLTEGRVALFRTAASWDPALQGYSADVFRSRGNLEHVFEPPRAEFAPGASHIDFDAPQLEGLDAVVVDIQDVGTRYFGLTRDVFRLLSFRARMEEGPSIYIVDRLNPAGRVVEGSAPALEPEPWTPRVAHRHGLTLGELCYMYCSEAVAHFPLHVISALASPASRELLSWTVSPSPDITGLFSCLMCSGGGLWNRTSVTPGIGTPRSYEYFGAPFINNAAVPPSPAGVLMRPCSFVPAYGMYEGDVCHGWQIILLPGAEYHSLLHTVQLMRWLSERDSRFEITPGLLARICDPVIEEYLRGGITFDIVAEHVKGEEQKWVRKARRFLLYDDSPYRIK